MLALGTERRRRGFVLLAGAVLGLHAALLAGMDATTPPAERARAAPVQVRAVLPDAPAAVLAEAAPVATAVAAPPAPARPAAPARPSAPRPLAIAPAAAAAELPPSVDSLPVAVDASVNPPSYPTRIPPAVTLSYDLQRGRFSGSGELRWLPDPERYELSLATRLAGLTVLAQHSQGGFDAAGLAPQRFTDRRARRPAQAANFERAAGKVMFSGTSLTLPLRAGVQDRLSWMIQLAAIAAADPQRRAPGAETVLEVVGARGDGGPWLFRCIGAEPLASPAGTIDALHYVREPRAPHDTAVEVWLDPALHHLPVRATIRNGAEGEALELRLREARLGA